MFAVTSTSFANTAIAVVGTVIFAGACLIGAAGPAAATPAAAVTVAYSDLNLSATSGRKTLDGRITQAARIACATGSNDVRSKDAEARCIKAAITEANGKVFVGTTTN